MKSITISSTFGTDLSSRRSGTRLRHLVAELVASSGVAVLDFDEVATVAESFADEALGVLVAQRGKDWFRDHVRLEHLNESVREAVLRSILHRLDLAAA